MFLKTVQTGSGSPIQRVTGFYFLSGLKRSRLEINHSRPSSTELNNDWSYTSSSPTFLHGVDFRFCPYRLLFFLLSPLPTKVGHPWFRL
jgi:hypothetical protein